MKRTTITATLLLASLPLTSCYETANLGSIPGMSGIPGVPGMPSVPGLTRGSRIDSPEEMLAVMAVAVIASYTASQSQRSVAQRRVQSSSSAKRSQTKYVAVAVPKKDGSKGKDVMLVNKDTNKPKDNKVYTVKNDVKAGKTYNIGGTNATAIDTIQGV